MYLKKKSITIHFKVQLINLKTPGLASDNAVQNDFSHIVSSLSEIKYNSNQSVKQSLGLPCKKTSYYFTL